MALYFDCRDQAIPHADYAIFTALNPPNFMFNTNTEEHVDSISILRAYQRAPKIVSRLVLIMILIYDEALTPTA